MLELGASEDQQVLEIFSRQLNFALDRTGYPPARTQRLLALCAEFGVSPSGARKWITGHGMPSPAMIRRIALTLHVSVDELLGLPAALGAPTAVPIWHIKPTSTGKSMGQPLSAFEKRAALSFSDPTIAACHHCFAVESWVEFADMGWKKGDLLLIDGDVQGIEENRIYLLRSARNTTFLRRARIRLDDSIEFVSPDQDVDPLSFSPEQIAFARSGTFEEHGERSKIMVLGRVSGAVQISR